jgi:hypothetical protein
LILLQRRKKYKTRTILGYKTLAEGVIKMDAVLQKSMDVTVDLSDAAIKNGRPGFPLATIRATQITSSPVDQIDNKNNNSVLIAGELNVGRQCLFAAITNFMRCLHISRQRNWK